MEDSCIIDLYFARDERAITETDKKYGGYCHQIAMNVLDDRLDAEECVNDTWLRTWNSIPPTRPHVLRLFLGKTTRCLALDKYRRDRARGRNKAVEMSLEELAECLPMREEEAGELPALLNAFLVALPATDRQIFVLRYWHAHPVSHIAKAYGLTTNAVSVRLYKTREKLRAYLTERGYGI